MHQITFGGQAPSRPAGGVYSAPHDLLAAYTSNGKRWEESEGRGEKGRGGTEGNAGWERKEGKGKRGKDKGG